MIRFVRPILVLGAALALAISAVTSVAAGGQKVLDSSMTALPTGSLVLDGVTGGGVPWSITSGHVQLFADGRLHVDVEGLVITATGVNPVTTGKAVLACGDAPFSSSEVVPFSSTGDATIDTVISMPAQCLAPAVFFGTATGRWFAVTGF